MIQRVFLLVLIVVAASAYDHVREDYDSNDINININNNNKGIDTNNDINPNDYTHSLVVPELAKTPQMGWNPWNLFRCNVSEGLVEEIARAMVDSGLHDLGYEYINLDDCWQRSRDSNGFIVEDFERFPSGMAALSKTIHGMGGSGSGSGSSNSKGSGNAHQSRDQNRRLKFGLYSDSGLMTCQRRPGGLGYELRDATTYASWNIDYLKYDNCYATGLGRVQTRYRRMHEALVNATTNTRSAGTTNGEIAHRPILFSLCEWGIRHPATWARSIGGNSWRTTGDIRNNWKSVVDIIDENNKWHSYAGPGGWNDPDMLQVGTTATATSSDIDGTSGTSSAGLTIHEQRAHFTMWCLMKAPLLLANDLRSIPEPVWDIISNKEMIAVNQDPLGIQGYKRWSSSKPFDGKDNENTNNSDDGPIEVWAGDLSGGDVVVVLFNRSGKTQTITAKFKDVIGILDEGGDKIIDRSKNHDDDNHDDHNANTNARLLRRRATTIAYAGAGANATHPSISVVDAHVRDLWAHSDLGLHHDEVTGVVPSHDVIALRLSNINIRIASKSVAQTKEEAAEE